MMKIRTALAVVAALALMAAPAAFAADPNGSGGGLLDWLGWLIGHHDGGGDPHAVPEFDPSVGGGIAVLLAGGGVVLSRRRRSSR